MFTNQRTERILRRVGAHSRIRSVYHRVVPARGAYARNRDAFLGEFVRPGDLVFDVGANQGEYAEMFLRLGARVVAIEPHPDLVDDLRLRAPAAVLERCAVGAREGSAD